MPPVRRRAGGTSTSEAAGTGESDGDSRDTSGLVGDADHPAAAEQELAGRRWRRRSSTPACSGCWRRWRRSGSPSTSCPTAASSPRRNLWNLSVQSTSIAIMATGMVLIIVSRNIDLSVGSLLGFLGYSMALVQTDGDPRLLRPVGDRRRARQQGVRLDRRPAVRPPARERSPAVCRASSSPTAASPSFIVTLGGFLVWRGMIFRSRRQAGPDARPAERGLPADRRRRQGLARRVAQLGPRAARLCPHLRDHLPGPPPAEAARPRAPTHVDRHHARRRRVRRRCSIGVGLVANRYTSPITGDPTGVAYPVVILILVTLGMNYLARRRPVRPLRVRLRRQPGGRRARRHQHPPHGDVHVRRDGRAVCGERRHPDRPPRRGRHRPRRAERARRHRRGGDRRHVVRRRHRDDPRRRARCDRHAVPAVGDGAAEDRLTVAGHRRRRGARDRGGHRLGAAQPVASRSPSAPSPPA